MVAEKRGDYAFLSAGEAKLRCYFFKNPCEIMRFSTLYYKGSFCFVGSAKNTPIKQHFLNFLLCKWENIILSRESLFHFLLTNEYADAIISAYAIFGYVLAMPENDRKT